MPGSQTEYDEKGTTVYYFLLSVWASIIIFATIFVLPKRTSNAEKERIRRLCTCTPCENKRQTVSTTKTTFKVAVIIIGWVVLLLLAYKVSTTQNDYTEYDPFQILQVDREASQHEIRKAYRKLSLEYHPDMATGDSEMFMKIAKAYAALTDEESKQNWKEYGNPDGPGAIIFGMALPKWMADQSVSLWIFVAYIVVFIVIMPICVGIWWYRNKFSKDRVLGVTTDLYMVCLYQNPNIKAIKLLGCSCEFDKNFNPKIVERPAEKMDELMNLLNKSSKKKKKNKMLTCSGTARALLEAHVKRYEFKCKDFIPDQMYILRKCPALINEMINILSHLVARAMARQQRESETLPRKRRQHKRTTKKERKHKQKPTIPSLKTVENCMKVSQMITQALESESSPLQQLPHIRPDMTRHFATNMTIRDFVAMDEDERRALLCNLEDSQYRDVMNVCALMPFVTMTIKCEVKGEKASTITAGSTVTVTVMMRRKNMMDEIDVPAWAEELATAEENVSHEDEHPVGVTNIEQKSKVWRKVSNKKGKKKPTCKKSKKSKGQEREMQTQKESLLKDTHKDEADIEKDVEKETESEEEETTVDKEKLITNKNDETFDEVEWRKWQNEIKKEITVDKTRESHPVHCPYFPDEKQEGWWLYVADRKNNMLITAPVHILSLNEVKELNVQLTAPLKVGICTYSVVIRSDSYLDLDYHQTIKLDVKEAEKTEDEREDSDSEDEVETEKNNSNDSDYSTDYDGFSDDE